MDIVLQLSEVCISIIMSHDSDAYHLCRQFKFSLMSFYWCSFAFFPSASFTCTHETR